MPDLVQTKGNQYFLVSCQTWNCFTDITYIELERIYVKEIREKRFILFWDSYKKNSRVRVGVYFMLLKLNLGEDCR